MDIEKKKKEFIKEATEVEEAIISNGGLTGEERDALMPLNHTFMDKQYMREIFMPAGTLLTSKIHKVEHPFFVMTGKCSVRTEEGWEYIEAPYVGVTKAGTKRILYIHEDCNWVTVHPTDQKDLKAIENEIIATEINDLKVCESELKKIEEASL